MGPIMAVYRPIVAVVTALSAGIACLFLTRGESDDVDVDALQEIEEHDHDHGHDHSHNHDHTEPTNQTSVAHGAAKSAWRERLARMAGYGYRTVLDEVAFWIVAGLVITGVLLALLPEDFFSSTLGLDSGILPMLLMAVIGVPLYTCASMSTPIAAGLIATGLSPGAALVFLLAGPATSIASLSIVGKLLGRRSMAAYLVSILVVAIGAGLLLDAFAAEAIRTATVQTFNTPDGDIEQAFKALCALIFLGMFVDSLGRKSYQEPLHDIRKQGSLLKAGLLHVRRLGYGVAAALLFIAAVPAVTLRVDPGQNGMIMRFGKVVEPALEPGLYFHLPWPVHTTRVVDVSDIREIFIAASTTEYLTSDENVIALTSAIQYRIDDPYAYEFRGEKNVDLLRDVASRILVKEILSRPIDDIYTTERSTVEREYGERLAAEISELNLGFELVEARLEHVHAPESVHDSFRDVSSALEDRQKSKFEAESRAIELVTDARGRQAESVAIAEGDARARIQMAEGLAASFVPQAQTLSRQPEIGRYRLRLEAIERSFETPRKYLNTVPGSQGVDLWIDPTREDVIKFNYRE